MGSARQAWSVLARSRSIGMGLARQARLARLGAESYRTGMAGNNRSGAEVQVWHGALRNGLARIGV